MLHRPGYDSAPGILDIATDVSDTVMDRLRSIDCRVGIDWHCYRR
jgi:hypothetical protein